jgi:glycosyltransferase involved in cell wall biosynthesis
MIENNRNTWVRMNIKDSLISVIIPCYNSSSTIGRAIASVLNQTVSEIEIIVVDDASIDSDLTKKCIDDFNDSRVRFFLHEINKNGSAARNTGVLNSVGEYISFLDADDEWYPEHLEQSLNYFKELSSDKQIIYSKSLIKTGTFQDIVLPARAVNSDEHLSDYLFCNNGFIQTSSLFMLTSSMRINLFNEELIRHQDYDLVLRLESNGYQFSLCDNVGVIIHWENNDTDKKGGTCEYSYQWAINNKKYFSRESLKCFILSNCVLKLFINGNRVKGLKLFFKDCIKWYSLKQLYKIISIFFFKKVIFSKI